MKIPKKLIAGVLGAITTAAPLVSDIVSEKLKLEAERKEKERIYANQKHNGLVKYASIIFALISLFISTLAFKQAKISLGIVGTLAFITYIITFLYCLEIIHEKKHNTYKLIFIIGDMLLIIVVTLLFF